MADAQPSKSKLELKRTESRVKKKRKGTMKAAEEDLPPYLKLDANDSKDPSYTEFTLPYYVICRERYRRAGQEQRRQFMKEIRDHELLQTKALDGVRIHREFCNVVMTPPRASELIKLTIEQRMKIEKILATDQVE